jgi:hypothetical protein
VKRGVLASQTAIDTRTRPRTSAGDGTWNSTPRPTASEVAGSRAVSSAKVAAGIRAKASWSTAYGTAEDSTATPITAASVSQPNRGSAAGSATGA